MKKKLLGWALILAPFAAAIGTCWSTAGLRVLFVALGIVCVCMVLSAIVTYGITLLTDDTHRD